MLKAIMKQFTWNKKIRLGICAMDKKSRSKPMTEILKRFPAELFEIIIFGDDVILNQPIENWPVVEVLIAFYSTKFPTTKAMAYVNLRKPFSINDLEMDAVLKDRRRVYRLLQSQGIDVPVHVFVNREDPTVENVIEEFDEYIVVNGVQINKPLVEKPVDAEDHNIYIYYPMSAGGGSKRLFRKINDRSSEFYPNVNELRNTGSYIYEEFLVTQGTDVKVYTVGCDYGHAEARKSPVVDGRVKRDSNNLEIRYPVILSHTEKEIARKVVTTFRQTVCGFDILRVQGKSYCCDVNGFSFVKNSRKYYDDASQILVELMVKAVRPEMKLAMSTRAPLMRLVANRDTLNNLGGLSPAYREGSVQSQVETSSLVRDEEEELRCVIAVVRHGDRTPKQKMKIKVTEPKYLEYFHTYCKNPRKDLKVKSKSALVRFLEVTREVTADVEMQKKKELLRQLKQIKDVLERWEISGINRKLQMKPQKWESSGDLRLSVDGETTLSSPVTKSSLEKSASGKVMYPNATEVLLILKWGGDLTPLGRQQAERLGTTFRHVMYPDIAGGGMLRLHATYRHDLKIKASDEGRVMKTAAAFAKGLLELEGPLTPILASLVTVEENNKQMLDREGNHEIKEEMDHCKEHLQLLQTDQVLTEEIIEKIAPGCPPRMKRTMMSLHNPMQTLQRMHSLIGLLCDQVQQRCRQQEELDSVFSNSSCLPPLPPPHGNTMNHPRPEGLDTSISQEEDSGIDMASVSLFDSCGDPLSLVLENNNTGINSICPSPVPFPSGPVSPLTSASSAEHLSGQDYCCEPNGNMIDISRRQSSATVEEDALNNSNNDNVSVNSVGNDVSVRTMNAANLNSGSGLYLGEPLCLMVDRWEKLYKDFYSAKKGRYDLSKVADVYDSIRYEVLHNSHMEWEGMRELLDLATKFENSIVPQEYGHDKDEKRKVGSKVCHFLLQKIKIDLEASRNNTQVDLGYLLDSSHAEDLDINSLGRAVRTRLYFTSESHLHSLLNVLRFPAEGKTNAFCPSGLQRLDNVTELSYLTQVIIRLFEDKADPTKFRCEISFSPGATNDPWSPKNSELAPYFILNKNIPCDQLLECLYDAIQAGEDENKAVAEETAQTTGNFCVSDTFSNTSTPRETDSSSNVN